MATHQSPPPKDRNMVVRLPESLYDRVEEIAREQQRTISGEVRWLMERRVREHDAEKAPPVLPSEKAA